MVYWIASYPRSGNTLCRLCLNHYWNIKSTSTYIPPKNYEHLSSDHLFGNIPPRTPSQEDFGSPDNLFFKTHELPSDDWPAIYIIRNGLDTLYSYARFILSSENFTSGPYREYNPDQLVSLLVTDSGFFGGWTAHIQQWTSRNAPTAILRYEDLISPGKQVTALQSCLKEIGIAVSPPSLKPLPSLSDLREENPVLFRKGTTGEGSIQLSPSTRKLFEREHGEMMSKLGYLNV